MIKQNFILNLYSYQKNKNNCAIFHQKDFIIKALFIILDVFYRWC